jgi:hypothetical protein
LEGISVLDLSYCNGMVKGYASGENPILYSLFRSADRSSLSGDPVLEFSLSSSDSGQVVYSKV